MTVGMNLIDQLSAAAPVASTMHTAAQAVVPAVAPAMPPEAPLEVSQSPLLIVASMVRVPTKMSLGTSELLLIGR